MLFSLRVTLASFALMSLALAASPPVLSNPDAIDVRIGADSGRTRFVLELSEAPSYRIFTLPDPYRVVIDLPALNWSIPVDDRMRDQGSISALRFGLFSPATSRVVLDLNEPVAVERAFVLGPEADAAHRLVVDLMPIERLAFLAPEQRIPILSKRPLPKHQARTVPAVTEEQRSDKRPTIIIDPGHGGVDPGAVGVKGTLEKDLVLDYADEVKRQLEATGAFRVVLTRSKDVFLRLRDRIAVAQQARGDLFVSLHANAHAEDTVRGASVYSLSEKASDAEAAALAAKENKADIIAGVDLTDQTDVVSMILIDLAQRDTMNLSTRFARYLVGELDGTTVLLKNPRRSAGFVVLKSPNLPSILFEIGYMSNAKEAKDMLSEQHRKRIAATIVRAVERFFTWQETVKRS